MSERAKVAIGMLQVAIGRVDGLVKFGSTVQSFLNSLAPLLALPLAAALIQLVRGSVINAISTVLVITILQLAPAVVSHFLAVFWKREDQWLHYATAYNWCFWALLPVWLILTVVFGTALGAGLPEAVATNGVVVGLGLYSLWLHWFLARHGLDLNWWKSAILVVAVNGATMLLIIGPAQLG